MEMPPSSWLGDKERQDIFRCPAETLKMSPMDSSCFPIINGEPKDLALFSSQLLQRFRLFSVC